MADTPLTEQQAPLGERITLMLLDRLTAPQFILAIVSTVFLWWLTDRLFSDQIPDRMREVVSVLVGFITGQMVGPGWQFYFGTTQGSEKKTVALADNAASMRQTGMFSAPDREPIPVQVKQPAGIPVPVADARPADPDLEIPSPPDLGPRPGDSQ